jgi:hypothetical protein
MSLPEKRQVKTAEYTIDREHRRRSGSKKSNEVDSYISDAYNYYSKLRDIIDKERSNYVVYTYYLDSSTGPFKAVQLRSGRDEDRKYNITNECTYRKREVETLAEMKSRKPALINQHRAALDGLSKLGNDAEEYRGYVNEFKTILDECFEIVESLYQEKFAELTFLESVIGSKQTFDGVASTDECMLCPLAKDDVLPDYPLQHVTYFDMKE